MDVKRYTEYLTVSRMSVVQAGIIGLIVGILMFGGARLLDEFILQGILCSDNPAGLCGSTQTTAIVVTTIIVQFMGLLALVRANILRPLLVVLAAVSSLVGLHVWLGIYSWWLAGLIGGMSMSIAYVYFTWVNRMARFPVALGLTVLSVVVVRLLLSYS